VTSFGNLVYVLNASANPAFTLPNLPAETDTGGSITGYTVGADGTLTPIAGSTQPTGVGPREVSFDQTGKTLVVSNRSDNNFSTYAIGAGGAAGAPVNSPSATPYPFGPFGFTFDAANHLITSDSHTSPSLAVSNPGGGSSYSLGANGMLTPITAFVPDGHGANVTCWAIVVGDYAYMTNPLGNASLASIPNVGPGTVTSYHIGADGSLTLAQSVAGTAPGSPGLPAHLLADEAVSRDGKYLYVLDITFPPNFPDQGQVDTFAINGDGTLTLAGATAPLPGGPGFTGLASG
jgi:6-phosphogluconolactonase (cycloisomerase 2 family)